jgi:AMMECR1 domain-containing protein
MLSIQYRTLSHLSNSDLSILNHLKKEVTPRFIRFFDLKYTIYYKFQAIIFEEEKPDGEVTRRTLKR